MKSKKLKQFEKEEKHASKMLVDTFNQEQFSLFLEYLTTRHLREMELIQVCLNCV